MSSIPIFTLINSLTRLAGISDGFKKSAFLKAIASLKKFPHSEIARIDMVNLPGVGKGILQRFDELVSNGSLAELEGKEDEGSILELFEGIYGVGPVLAKKWYQQGFRTLDDIPVNTLNVSQSLGLKYYHDINSRIPRSEIDQIGDVLQSLIDEYNTKHDTCVRAQICGSYLRGKESSGDIDIIISEKNNTPFIISFITTGLFHYILAKGNTKILTLGGLKGFPERRIDLEIVPDEHWAFALLYFTGSKDFNKYMRGIAKDKGYLLNHSGLFSSSGDSVMHAGTEREIFDFLGIEWYTPSQRDAFVL